MELKTSKIIFGNFSGVIEYKKLVELYKKYEQAKKKNKEKEMEKLKAEIIKLSEEAKTDLIKVKTIFEKSLEEVKKEGNVAVIERGDSYIQKINEMIDDINVILKELGG
ncbi:MAG: hypothetical protein ACP5HJ_01710 [Candidatus Micrarchaeia archaeon]